MLLPFLNCPTWPETGGAFKGGEGLAVCPVATHAALRADPMNTM